jgi:UDP-N-acetyl-D-glucosamine dehydrogenase
MWRNAIMSGRMSPTLQQKLESNAAVVGVIGLGYVGLPLAQVFHGGGLGVLGFDTDPAKVEALAAGRSYIKHIPATVIAKMRQGDRFAATDDFVRLAEADAVLICVPTPLDEHRKPDLSYVEQTADVVGRHLRAGQLVVLESTTYPGTTREIVKPRLETSGLQCGKDFYLAYSPEREDPGRRDFNTQTIPKLVGGLDETSGDLAQALYSKAVKNVVRVSSAEVAEAAKLLENIYRAVNIALVNEMKLLLDRMGIDVWEVIDAAATKPFGFQRFDPGPGLGGHCIPIDPFYLTWKARQYGLSTRFIELAGEVNHAMPDYVVQRVAYALNTKGKAIRGSRVLVLGLAYKPDVDDVRESPSLVLIEKLGELGAAVDFHDPHIPATHKMRHHDLQMTSIELTDEALAGYDCVVIATHHSVYDWHRVARCARLIVDSRGVMRHLQGPRDHIIGA